VSLNQVEFAGSQQSLQAFLPCLPFRPPGRRTAAGYGLVDIEGGQQRNLVRLPTVEQ
jgi:hypothetical protein